MKQQLSNILVVFALLLSIILEVVGCKGCKDMEDCRSKYSHILRIEFKGLQPLKFDHAAIEIGPNGAVTRLEDLNQMLHPTDKKNNLDALKNLQNKQFYLPLDPDYTEATLFFYKEPADTTPNERITIYYQVYHSLLSPHCGIQAIFVIEDIKTSFPSSNILVPEKKLIQYKPHVEISY